MNIKHLRLLSLLLITALATNNLHTTPSAADASTEDSALGTLNTHLKTHRHTYAAGLGAVGLLNLAYLFKSGKLSKAKLKRLFKKENRAVTTQLILGSLLPFILAGGVEFNGYGYAKEQTSPKQDPSITVHAQESNTNDTGGNESNAVSASSDTPLPNFAEETNDNPIEAKPGVTEAESPEKQETPIRVTAPGTENTEPSQTSTNPMRTPRAVPLPQAKPAAETPDNLVNAEPEVTKAESREEQKTSMRVTAPVTEHTKTLKNPDAKDVSPRTSLAKPVHTTLPQVKPTGKDSSVVQNPQPANSVRDDKDIQLKPTTTSVVPNADDQSPSGKHETVKPTDEDTPLLTTNASAADSSITPEIQQQIADFEQFVRDLEDKTNQVDVNIVFQKGEEISALLSKLSPDSRAATALKEFKEKLLSQFLQEIQKDLSAKDNSSDLEQFLKRSPTNAQNRPFTTEVMKLMKESALSRLLTLYTEELHDPLIMDDSEQRLSKADVINKSLKTLPKDIVDNEMTKTFANDLRAIHEALVSSVINMFETKVADMSDGGKVYDTSEEFKHFIGKLTLPGVKTAIQKIDDIMQSRLDEIEEEEASLEESGSKFLSELSDDNIPIPLQRNPENGSLYVESGDASLEGKCRYYTEVCTKWNALYGNTYGELPLKAESASFTAAFELIQKTAQDDPIAQQIANKLATLFTTKPTLLYELKTGLEAIELIELAKKQPITLTDLAAAKRIRTEIYNYGYGIPDHSSLTDPLGEAIKAAEGKQ